MLIWFNYDRLNMRGGKGEKKKKEFYSDIYMQVITNKKSKNLNSLNVDK